jgi:hypothetical protein
LAKKGPLEAAHCVLDNVEILDKGLSKTMRLRLKELGPGKEWEEEFDAKLAACETISGTCRRDLVNSIDKIEALEIDEALRLRSCNLMIAEVRLVILSELRCWQLRRVETEDT